MSIFLQGDPINIRSLSFTYQFIVCVINIHTYTRAKPTVCQLEEASLGEASSVQCWPSPYLNTHFARVKMGDDLIRKIICFERDDDTETKPEVLTALKAVIFDHLKNVEIMQSDCNILFNSMKCWTINIQNPKRTMKIIDYNYKWNDFKKLTMMLNPIDESEFVVSGMLKITIPNYRGPPYFLCFGLLVKIIR